MASCINCGKEILEPNIGYGINPDAICRCPIAVKAPVMLNREKDELQSKLTRYNIALQRITDAYEKLCKLTPAKDNPEANSAYEFARTTLAELPMPAISTFSMWPK